VKPISFRGTTPSISPLDVPLHGPPHLDQTAPNLLEEQNHLPEPAGGTFSVGIANPGAEGFSNGTVGLAAVALSLFVVSFPLGGVLPAGGAGVSTLPRMIGKPSLRCR
jgi:hypothetical protein